MVARSVGAVAIENRQVWREARRAEANQVSLSSWDYKRLTATGAQAGSTLDNGVLPALEWFEGAPAYRFESDAAALTRTDRLLATKENDYRLYQGEGSVRQLAEGRAFSLEQHEDDTGDAARFRVLAVEHRGANNLGAGAAELLAAPDIEAGTYRNRLLAQPGDRPLLPRPRPKPVALPQSALVVGLPGAPLTTERDHRIKLQFHWQRGESPNPGGLAGDATLPGKNGHAPGDDRSGTWVRVAEWLAGPDWGSQFLPRVGTEVLVDFVAGDLDRPLVVAQLHNGEDAVPLPGGVAASANHPGVLSGWMSHNHDAGFNQWLVDDAPGQGRTRLATSTAAGQLSLGHLLHQAPASAWRGAWRGSGFELRSDAWLTVRSGEGMLLSATARPEGISTQLDMAEAVAQLRGAEATAVALSEAALAQAARPLEANAALTGLLENLDPEHLGCFTGDVGGQPAQKAVPGSRELAEATERFAQPIVVSEAPGDVGLASPASALLHAGGHLHGTVQGEAHLAAGRTVAAAVGEGAGWFIHAGGVKAVAAAGPVSLQAHGATLEILADQAVTVTSVQGEVQILADAQVVLQAGEAAVTLAGSDVSFVCPGTFSVKGSGNAFVGPGNGAAEVVALPEGLVNAEFSQQATLLKPESLPYEQHRYQFKARSGKLVEGVFGADSTTQRLYTERSEPVEVYMTEFRIDQIMTEDVLAGIEGILGSVRSQTTPETAEDQSFDLPLEEV